VLDWGFEIFNEGFDEIWKMKGLMKSGKFSAKGFHQKLEKLSPKS
jgi:hypothetical protein